MAGVLTVLQLAAPVLNKPSTKKLALHVKAHARPGDRVVHYHAFFHDFTFYAQRVVDVDTGHQADPPIFLDAVRLRPPMHGPSERHKLRKPSFGTGWHSAPFYWDYA